MLTFGDVVRIKEEEYVYLAATDEIIYSAKILGHQETTKINNLYIKKQSSGALVDVRVANSPLYCFVILTTREFEKRMAHFHQPGRDFQAELERLILGKLNEGDMKEIKQTILSGPVPMELKELVKNIMIL